jgi:hypothetical protein
MRIIALSGQHCMAGGTDFDRETLTCGEVLRKSVDRYAVTNVHARSMRWTDLKPIVSRASMLMVAPGTNRGWNRVGILLMIG